MATARITVTLPADLLAAADARLLRDGEGRSGLLRRLVAEALRRQEEQEQIARYVRGYTEQPETPAETAYLKANYGVLEELPYDETAIAPSSLVCYNTDAGL